MMKGLGPILAITSAFPSLTAQNGVGAGINCVISPNSAAVLGTSAGTGVCAITATAFIGIRGMDVHQCTSTLCPECGSSDSVPNFLPV